MKKIIFIVVIICLCESVSTLAQIQEFIWAKQMTGTDESHGNSIAVDVFGNVYTTGSFNETVDFDPGPAVFNFTTQGNKYLFISKINSSGNLVWAKAVGNNWGDVIGYAITIDVFGNILLTGTARGTTDFDPGPGIFNLGVPASFTDIFVCKFDPLGNFIWAKEMGGIGNEYSYAITTDNSGNVYTTGSYEDNGDYNPGAGVFTLVSSGGNDVFISKLDSLGNFIWAKAFNGPGTSGPDAFGKSIAVDPLGNVYTTGSFSYEYDFDPSNAASFTMSAASYYNIFISKLNSAGEFIWAKQIGGGGHEFANSLLLDSLDNIFITGELRGNTDFDTDTGTYYLTSAGGRDIFIFKGDSSGNLIWVKQMGAVTGNGFGNSIALDLSGNILTTGWFSGVVDFDPDSIGTYYLPLNGSSYGNIFISKLSPSGNLIWAKSINEATFWNEYWAGYIAVDQYDNILLTGSFGGIVDFDPDTLFDFNLSTQSFYDIFVMKLGQCNETYASINATHCYSYTSPSGNHTWITSGIYLDTIANNIGCDSVITVHLSINNSTSIQIVTDCYSFTTPSGTYTWITSGTYYDIIQNSMGCDSIIEYVLSINTTSSTQNINCCNSTFHSPSGNQTWYLPGIYHDTIPNTAGCDSLITINLSFNTIDTSVSHFGSTLIAVVISGSYQWLDCTNNFTPINGATNQVFVPTSYGNYSVAITQYGCTDTSACYTISGAGINEITPSNNFQLFPNPTADMVTVQLHSPCSNCTIEISNVLGEILFTDEHNQKSKICNLQSFPSGIYFIKVKSDKWSEVKRVVKE